MDDLANTM
jgi:hypothetical protein